MRNLYLFLWKYQFTFLFLLLEFAAFSLIVQGNKFHRAKFLNATTAVSGTVFKAVNELTKYLKLNSVNKELAKENARLQSLLKGSLIQLQGNLVTIHDTNYQQRYQYIESTVISNTVNKRNNFLVLDKGSRQGIESEMGVICADGIVGVVRDVSANYCSVLSILHKETQISVMIEKNRYYGILTWDGQDAVQANLKGIAKHVKVEAGDTIITRGSSAIFPANIMVGTVNEIETVPGSNFLNIRLILSTNFQNLSYAYIVKNLMKEEQKQLEKTFEDDSHGN